MINQLTHITTMLLVCAVLITAKATSNCSLQNEDCGAYNDAKAATSPVYLYVNVTLSDFINTPDDFNQKFEADYEPDSIPDEEGCIGRQACYKLTNQQVGCREKIVVEGD